MKNQKRTHKQSVYRFRRFAHATYSVFNSMHRVVNIGVISGCMLTFAHATSVSGQTSDPENQVSYPMEKELEEVMVTASKVEIPIDQTAKLVTVISKEQIAQSPVQSIEDLLVYVASIDVVQRGGHGVQADISIRGGSSDQNAVLLNGVNITNPHTGHYSFDIPINLSDIERIEIIHGPSALIYGASAFSGGINIVTKKKADTKIYANLEAGMHNQKGIEVRSSMQTGLAVNSLSVGHSSSDGYTDNSDYTIYNALWQTRFNLDGESKLDIQLGYNDKKYGANTFYSPKYPNQYDQTSTYMGAVKGEFGSKLKIIPIIYWNRHHDQFDLIKGSGKTNYHRNDTYGANLIFAYQSKLGTTSFGGELRKEDIMSNDLGKKMVTPHRKYTKYDDRTNSSLTLEHTFVMDQFAVSAGVLMNHNTLLKDKYQFFPSLSATYRPIDGFSISSSWCKSTRMPTFVDLYITSETHSGDESLRPEKSESLDLGIKYKSSLIDFYLTGYLMWGKNIIDWVKDDVNDPTWASWNHTELKTQGLETGMKLKIGEITSILGDNAYLMINYARINKESDTKGLISKYSLSYLRDKFTTNFNHQIYGGFSAGWFLRYQNRMGTYEDYDTGGIAHKRNFPAFSTLDLKLNYIHNDLLSFYINLNNLYDTEYFDTGNVPQAGFWLMGGIKYTIK